jgi:hypothetical protein
VKKVINGMKNTQAAGADLLYQRVLNMVGMRKK